jgi:hypothetical protein
VTRQEDVYKLAIGIMVEYISWRGCGRCPCDTSCHNKDRDDKICLANIKAYFIKKAEDKLKEIEARK